MAGRPDEQDLAAARSFARSLAEHVVAGRTGSLPESRPDALKPGWGFYDLASLFLTDPVARFLLPEPKPAPDRCDQCQWCANVCPVQNITLDPYPVVGGECIRCYRCSSGCPQGAFDVNWQFGNLAIWSLYNTAFERLFGDLQPGEQIY
jgi:ferredoxin